MPLFAAFVGPAYRARSPVIASDALVNLYVEATELAEETKKSALYGTPGLRRLLTVGDQGARGGFSQDGRTFFVVGSTLYEIDVVNATATPLGSVANDGKPVSMVSNGRGGEQLLIVGGGEVKVLTLTTNALSAPVALPLTNAPVMAAFLDGYFLLLERSTVRVWYSALEDGTSWDALDFFARSGTSDNLVGIAIVKDRVWVLGSLTSEVFYDSGDADNPFIPYPGSTMFEGLTSPWAMTAQGESIFWLSQDNQGRQRMVVANDTNPTPITTPAISYALSTYTTLSDAELLAYEQSGHPFICWTFPSADLAGVTWVYDNREQNWHQRSTWNSNLGIDMKWRARGFAADPNGLVVGDWDNGNLYFIDPDVYTDNGGTIRRVRRAPYLSPENQWVFLDRFELGMEAGVGDNTTTNPVLMLSLSRDGGKTWVGAGDASYGAQGAYDHRAVWRQLGRTRVDRLVLEVVQTDPVKCVWGPGAWLRMRPGAGTL
jgi:hypothetical protein